MGYRDLSPPPHYTLPRSTYFLWHWCPNDVFQRAMEQYKVSWSLRGTAKHFQVDKMSLKRYIKSCTENHNASFGYKKCQEAAMVFSKQMDRALADHVKRMAMKFHRLSKEKVLQLAYVFAKSNNTKMPPSCERNEKAGQTFWLNFKTRIHLSVRTPEGILSLTKMTA